MTLWCLEVDLVVYAIDVVLWKNTRGRGHVDHYSQNPDVENHQKTLLQSLELHADQEVMKPARPQGNNIELADEDKMLVDRLIGKTNSHKLKTNGQERSYKHM